jgi:antirestriction protein ArdC
VDGFTPSTIDAPQVMVIPAIEQAEAFVAATGTIIHRDGGRAYYRPSPTASTCRPAKLSSAPQRARQRNHTFLRSVMN